MAPKGPEGMSLGWKQYSCLPPELFPTPTESQSPAFLKTQILRWGIAQCQSNCLRCKNWSFNPFHHTHTKMSFYLGLCLGSSSAWAPPDAPVVPFPCGKFTNGFFSEVSILYANARQISVIIMQCLRELIYQERRFMLAHGFSFLFMTGQWKHAC